MEFLRYLNIKAVIVLFVVLTIYIVLFCLFPLSLVFLTFLFAFVFVSNTWTCKLEKVGYGIINVLLVLKKPIDLLYSLLYSLFNFLGHLTIVFLLGISLFLLGVKAFPLIIKVAPHLQNYHNYFFDIFTSKVYWSAATTIVATTLALGHMRNFNIVQERFNNEEYDRYKKEQAKSTRRVNPLSY